MISSTKTRTQKYVTLLLVPCVFLEQLIYLHIGLGVILKMLWRNCRCGCYLLCLHFCATTNNLDFVLPSFEKIIILLTVTSMFLSQKGYPRCCVICASASQRRTKEKNREIVCILLLNDLQFLSCDVIYFSLASQSHII